MCSRPQNNYLRCAPDHKTITCIVYQTTQNLSALCTKPQINYLHCLPDYKTIPSLCTRPQNKYLHCIPDHTTITYIMYQTTKQLPLHCLPDQRTITNLHCVPELIKIISISTRPQNYYLHCAPDHTTITCVVYQNTQQLPALCTRPHNHELH